MSKNLPIVLVIVVFVVIAFAGIFYLSFRSASSNLLKTSSPLITPSDTSRAALKNIHVPSPNETNINPEIAVPKIAKDTLPGQVTKVREFDIMAQSNQFKPSKIIVYEGDVVSITFFPADKAYDIAFPDFSIQSPVKEKENITVQFQTFGPGIFPFTCLSCEPNQRPKGTLTVVPR